MSRENPYSMYPDEDVAFDEGHSSGGGMGRPTPEGNPLGVVGLILSILGPLAPFGVVVSAFALRREPRGVAIAGLIVGLVMTPLAYICGGLIGLGVWGFFASQGDYDEISNDFLQIQRAVAEYQNANDGDLPDDLDALSLPPDVIESPYGERYVYQRAAGSWSLGFKGMDQQQGTQDDTTLPGDLSGSSLANYQHQPLMQALANGRVMDAIQ